MTSSTTFYGFIKYHKKRNKVKVFGLVCSWVEIAETRIVGPGLILER
jgi:hypothetical protein